MWSTITGRPDPDWAHDWDVVSLPARPSTGEARMQVYRLEPKGGDTRDPNWAATTLKFKCWVLADSEDNARQAVMLATGIGAVLSLDSLSPLVLGCAVTLLIVFQIKRLGMSRPLA
jgi:hypothetical protein